MFKISSAYSKKEGKIQIEKWSAEKEDPTVHVQHNSSNFLLDQTHFLPPTVPNFRQFLQSVLRFLLHEVSQILHIATYPRWFVCHANENSQKHEHFSFLKLSISYGANFVWDINVIRGKDCLCIFAFMQIGQEIRNLAGRYVLWKTQIHNSGLQPCPNIQSRDILCGNILF